MELNGLEKCTQENLQARATALQNLAVTYPPGATRTEIATEAAMLSLKALMPDLRSAAVILYYGDGGREPSGGRYAAFGEDRKAKLHGLRQVVQRMLSELDTVHKLQAGDSNVGPVATADETAGKTEAG